MNANTITRQLQFFLALTACVLAGSPVTHAQDAARQYAVKFVCGQADGRILAEGIYTTAINIHNPNQTGADPVKFRKRFAVALPSEVSGGTTDFIDGAAIESATAIEIDCPDIFENARALCGGPFCKGFVLIDSVGELDIVAVYSAADGNSGQVTSLHTERVTSAGRCPVTSVDVASQTIFFVPPHVRGDREFDGHGPCVRFDYDLRTKDGGTVLIADYYMHAYECSDDFAQPRSDHTAAEGRGELMLLSAGPGGRIISHNLENRMTHTYIDTDHSNDTFNFGGSVPVQSLNFRGDTDGSESGTKTSVFVETRGGQVLVENCGGIPNPD